MNPTTKAAKKLILDWARPYAWVLTNEFITPLVQLNLMAETQKLCISSVKRRLYALLINHNAFGKIF
jgi:hypothetical protein